MKSRDVCTNHTPPRSWRARKVASPIPATITRARQGKHEEHTLTISKKPTTQGCGHLACPVRCEHAVKKLRGRNWDAKLAV
jgi:aldehyde:ferredoxin oxidoreductase